MIDIEELNRLHAATTHGEWNNGAYPESTYVWDDVIGNSPIAECDFTDHSINESLANAAWIASSHNAWPEIAAELQGLADIREDLPRLHACAKEWQVYSERIETETDAAMAEEIQRLRREHPKAMNELRDANEEIQRLCDENARLKAAITSINEDGLPSQSAEQALRDVWHKASELQRKMEPYRAYRELFRFIDEKWIVAARIAKGECAKCGGLGVKNGLGETGKCDCEAAK